MESLPLLPGYIFSCSDPMLKDYKLNQKLKFLNGFRMIRDNYDPDDFRGNDKIVEYDPALTYGRPRKLNKYEQKRFLPHYVIYDRKCLSFEAYFKQGIFGSPEEFCRVRRVKIFYYLEDDTIAVIEPTVDNAGFKQGKLVRRSRILVPGRKDRYYHWKDLNIGIDIEIYGVVYRIVNGDTFTLEFLKSQGIDLNAPEDLPDDPYLRNRAERDHLASFDLQRQRSRGLETDQRYRFLEFDGMVLTFDALWDDEFFKVRYFLTDDTISVCEVRRPNDGKDAHSNLLLKRTKIPKNWKDLPSSHPAIYMEKNEDDIKEFYSPSDLKVGETIFIFGRRFLLYDCDPFTRKYYSDMLRMEQSSRIPVPDESKSTCQQRVNDNEPVGKTKSIDLIRKLYNFPKKLRYSLIMDVVHPEDEGREFVLEYNLSDGAIRINEFERRNSGRIAGRFLNWNRVPKPNSSEYYSPEDFYINSKLKIFGHWFIITGTEPFVYKYMCANPQKFNENLIENIKEHLKLRGLIEENSCTNNADEADDKVKEKNIEDQQNELCDDYEKLM